MVSPSGFTFVRAPTGMNGLTGRQYLPIRVSFLDEARQPHFSDLFGQIINAGQGEGALFGAAGDKSA